MGEDPIIKKAPPMFFSEAFTHTQEVLTAFQEAGNKLCIAGKCFISRILQV
jgi:hypothetical protein